MNHNLIERSQQKPHLFLLLPDVGDQIEVGKCAPYSKTYPLPSGVMKMADISASPERSGGMSAFQNCLLPEWRSSRSCGGSFPADRGRRNDRRRASRSGLLPLQIRESDKDWRRRWDRRKPSGLGGCRLDLGPILQSLFVFKNDARRFGSHGEGGFGRAGGSAGCQGARQL